VKINVSIDSTRLLSRLKNSETRIAFAVVNALNATAKKIQENERARLLRDFTVRDKSPSSFLMRQGAKITTFASVGRAVPYVEIAIEQKGRLLLPLFESGGARPALKGKEIAIPIPGSPARPAFAQPVPDAFQFAQLHFAKTRPLGSPAQFGRRKRSKKSSGEAVRFGAQRTFLIPNVGVFQRTSRGKSELLYAFVSHETLPKKAGFVDVAEATIAQWWPAYIDKEIADALAHHPNEA